MDKTHLAPGAYERRAQGLGKEHDETAIDSDEDFLSTHLPSRPVSAMDQNAHPSQRKPHKIVLCFDGTGNKFHGDGEAGARSTWRGGVQIVDWRR